MEIYFRRSKVRKISNKMKFCLLLVSFVISVSLSEGGVREEWKAGMRPIQEECKEISNLDDATFKYISETGDVNEKDRKVVDYVYCLVRKVDFMDDNGNLKEKNIDAHLKRMEISKEVRDKTEKKCQDVEKPDVHLLTFRYYHCFASQLPRNVQLV